MASISYTSNDWIAMDSLYPNKANLNNKILGILYFTILRKIAFRNMKANIITCSETGINIVKVHDTIQKLANYQDFIFDISQSIERLNPIIKIADYIASARRKVKKTKLETYANYKIINKKDIPRSVYKKII